MLHESGMNEKSQMLIDDRYLHIMPLFKNSILQNGSIAVSDYENKWISIFDVDGKFLTKYGAGKLLGPKGIVVNIHGDLVTVDNKVNLLYFVYKAKYFH